MERIRRRLSFANVISVLALFVALGGGAWAISKNSVGSKQLKPKAVKTSDLAQNAVKSGKVADGKLRAKDFADGELPAGPQGPPGAEGPAGQTGAPGADATNLFAYVRDPSPAEQAVIHYGEGATGVSDAAGETSYAVTFDRALAGCTAHATPGSFPGSFPSTTRESIPTVVVTNQAVSVTLRQPTFSGGVLTMPIVDSSFFLSVFC